jgi:peptide chain release factor 3
VAFLRVCSGRFERGMEVVHAQTGKSFHLRRPYKLFANEREIIDEAHPGDVIGLPSSGELGIGDTLCESQPFQFAPIPRFHPEHFAFLHNRDVGKQKQFRKGLQQLETEGAVQVLHDVNAFRRDPILGAVGVLQFDLVQARLENEYNVPTDLQRLPGGMARWVTGPEESIERLGDGSHVILCRDGEGNAVALFQDRAYLRPRSERFPELTFETRG